MNSINKLFAAPDEHQDSLNQDDTVLVLPKKMVNCLVIFALLSGFGIFTAGYFLGKRKTVAYYAAHLERETFSDHINFSLNTLYDRYATNEDAPQEESVEKPPIIACAPTPAEIEAQPATLSMKSFENNTTVPLPKTRYQAQLVGGPSKMIQLFVDRLAKRGITVESRRRISKTAQGKKIYWSQAVTPLLATREEVDALVKRVEKTEKISGVKIVEITT